MKRWLIISAVAGILLLVALIITLAVVASSKNRCDDLSLNSSSASKSNVTILNGGGEKGNAICSTPGCIYVASKILDNMNPEIDPCDDFYEFACGGFLKSAWIPDDKIMIDTFTVVEDKLLEQLRTSIEEPSAPGEPRPFKLAKNFYKTCMNTSAIEEAGLDPLRKVLRQLGTWPVIEGDNWKEDDFNLMETIYKLQNLGYSVNYFINCGVIADWQNGTKNILVFDRASLSLPREYLIRGVEDKVVKAYFEYMVDIAVFLGADKQKAAQELKYSLEFEIQLANISLPEEKRRNFTLFNNPMTIAELGKQYPSINWMEFIDKMLPPSVEVDESEVIMVVEPNFIGKLEKILKNTSKRVQANYALWRAAASTVSYLSKDIRKRQLDYYATQSGQTERRARWKECLTIVAEPFSLSIGALYVRKYFQADAKKNAVEMVVDIRKEFNKILEKADWMDEKTRTKALDKAASLSSHIAYPDELLDDKKLEEFYAPLKFNTDDFISNILDLNIFFTNYSLEKLRKPVNKSEWITHGNPAEVNAYYTVTENSIQLPAGILQGMLFSKDRPRYMNYGVIGFIIGHEITHGFDDKGRQFDKNGNLVDWWEPETKEKFLKKAECIVHQYGNYTVESVGLNVNGIITEGENIADNGGIKVAYLAYKEWVERNGPELKLPGLDYTTEQLFWIGAANTWCVKNRLEAMKHYLPTQIHSPGQFRVIGPFSNRPEFTADFNCAVNSTMNPINKCSVW